MKKFKLTGIILFSILISIFIYPYNVKNTSIIYGMENSSVNLSRNSNYDDTILVINTNSELSISIGKYFASQRHINEKRIVYINTINGEEINFAEFNSQIRYPIEKFLSINNLTKKTNYIIITKGVPLKIYDIQRSVDSTLTLILGPYDKYIGIENTRIPNPYYGKKEHFSRNKFGIFLVTRLDGYNYTDIKKMIDCTIDTANNGTVIFDIDLSKKGTPYQIYNDEMINASNILRKKGINVIINTTFLLNQKNVLGYVSWGSNDASFLNHAKPNNTWLNGSIAETAVSTSARTFTYPPSYGQSLIADLISEGVTGAKGYVYEPYLDAIAKPDVLFDRYTDHFNLAESYYMASFYIGWKDIIVGDPKTHIR